MEMLRFTKYPLLLDNIAKYTGNHSSSRSLAPSAGAMLQLIST